MDENTKRIRVLYKEKECIAVVSVCSWHNYENEVIHFFNKDELLQYYQYKYEKRRIDFALGRIAAKNAIMEYTDEIEPQKILIKNGYFNQPVVSYGGLGNVQISISHCDHIGIAVAFPEELLIGLDIEKVNGNLVDILDRQLTDKEKSLYNSCEVSKEEIATVLWCAKESISKTLKIGFTVPLDVFEINEIIKDKNSLICKYSKFTLFQTNIYRTDQYFIAVTCPSGCTIILDKHFIMSVSAC